MLIIVIRNIFLGDFIILFEIWKFALEMRRWYCIMKYTEHVPRAVKTTKFVRELYLLLIILQFLDI